MGRAIKRAKTIPREKSLFVPIGKALKFEEHVFKVFLRPLIIFFCGAETLFKLFSVVDSSMVYYISSL